MASYRSIPATSAVRLAKPTSNLFRARTKRDARGLDTSGLTGVLSVDPETGTAEVAGMCTYEDLVAATLPYGLSPLVVPQLKTITLGGAVSGLGIESASFRNGLPHESVQEMDILTGAGELLTTELLDTVLAELDYRTSAWAEHETIAATIFAGDAKAADSAALAHAMTAGRMTEDRLKRVDEAA